MRVLMLTETFHPEIGGGERQARLLSEALTRLGHDVTVVTRRSRADLPGERVEDGVRIIRIAPSGPGRWKKWGLAGSAVGPLAALRSRIDVCFVSGYRILGVPAVIGARALGCPCVMKADSSGEMSGEFFRAGLAGLGLTPATAPVKLLIGSRNALLRQADAFVAISSEIAHELRACGVPANRIHDVPNAVDTTVFRPAAPEEQVALRRKLRLPGGPIAIYTGRLVSYKGLPLLLSVWGELRRTGTPGTLVLVGAGGGDMHACEGQLRSYVERHGLQDSVIFAGAVENVHEYLRACDVFVFPTENEAFGVSLVEAMACGLPAVATPVGGIRDFLEHGTNGLLVAPGDFAQLRSALMTLFAGGNQVARLGQAARTTALRRFSADAISQRYAKVFEAVIGPRAARVS